MDLLFIICYKYLLINTFYRRSKFIKLLKTITHAGEKPSKYIHEAITQKGHRSFE